MIDNPENVLDSLVHASHDESDGAENDGAAWTCSTWQNDFAYHTNDRSVSMLDTSWVGVYYHNFHIAAYHLENLICVDPDLERL